jgi:hypothetical protein
MEWNIIIYRLHPVVVVLALLSGWRNARDKDWIKAYE